MKKTSFGWFALNLSLTLGLSLLASHPAEGASGAAAGDGARAEGISGPLLNINFTAAANRQYVIKKGGAAVGVADDDFWNVYSRDDGHGGFATDGILRELRYADQQPSGATLVVSNAPGAWMNGAADPMFNWYLYPLAGGEIRVMLTQLVPGSYDFYIYGHGAMDDQNGVYEVVSGGTNYGTKATTTGPSWISPKMVEGLQYVRFENVRVTANTPVSITAKVGASGYALINGMQILAKTEAAGPDDGIPAAWRVKYFGTVDDPRAVATADPDADGANNYQEYLSGTNPLDERSVGLVPLTIKTYAGSAAGGRDGTLADATFTCPVSIRRDPQGRLWVCEATWTGWTQTLVGGHRIRIIDPVAGTVTTLAGSAEPGYVDGPAASARFTTPLTPVFDRQGNAFITERLGHRIRKIDRTGKVSTFAGSQAGNRDGRGTNAMFHTPGGTVIDANDNLYVADFDNYSIRKITPDGSVTTFAGNGPGDVDGDVKTAQFGCNYLALKSDGTLFVADWVDGKIRRISPAGQVTTLLAGLPYVEEVAIDAADHLYVSMPNGPVLNTYDLQGQLLWSLAVNNGFRDGPVAEAMAGRFNDLEFLPGGQVFFPDGANNRIRRLTLGPPTLLTVAPAGGPFTNAIQPRLATIVTNGLIRYTLDGSEPVKSSTLYGGPLILTSSATVKARVFVNGIPVSAIVTADFERRDAGNPADGIPGEWRVKYFGSVTDPRALAAADPDGDGANNYQEYLNGTNPLDANSTPRMPVAVSTYAGSIEGTNDGYRTRAQFNAGAGVTIAPDGGYWVWESNVIDYDVAGPGKHDIRVIDTNGMVTTLAGNESRVVDGPLNVARFASPSGLVFDSHGDAFVSDRMGNRVRKISQGVVTTLAGSTRGYRDGVGSHAQFGLLASIAIDAKDNLFVADFDNLRIRKITPTGIVTTYAGGTRGNQDGDRLDAGFNGPAILAFDQPGNLFISDWANNSLRKISTDGMVTTFKNSLAYVWDLSIDADNHVYTFASGESREYVYDPDGRLLWTLPAGAQGTFDSTWDGPLATAKIGRVGAVNFLKNGDLLFTDGPRVRILRMAVPPLLTIDPPAGGFVGSVTVRLSTVVTNGVIRYTLDGTEPTAGSAGYANRLILTTSASVKARVFVNGVPVSAVVTAVFQRTDPVNPADGIPADWRVKYFGSVTDPRAQATADPDGDGANNYQEYRNGTNPLDASSASRVPVSVSTYAGSNQGTNDGYRTEAQFSSAGVTIAPDGSYWVWESNVIDYDVAGPGKHDIRVIDTNGVVTTLAGNESRVVDGPLNVARFASPSGLVFDSHGDAFVSDRMGNRVRKISKGLVTTLAGSTRGYRDGQGSNAQFGLLASIAIDANDNLFVADFDNLRIRKITPAGAVSTYAGGARGAQDGDRLSATFNGPAILAFDQPGNLFISDWANHSLRKISTAGVVSTFKSDLTYVWDVSIDADNQVYTYASGENREYVYTPDGHLLWSLPAGAQEPYDSTWDGPLATAKIGRVGAVNFLKNGDLLFTDGPRVRILHLGIPPLLTVDAPTGAFTNTLTVRLSTVVSNGVIRFTLDGTEPGVNATPYENPLVLTQTTTLAARVFVNGIPVSAIWTGLFTRADGGSRITYLPNPVTVSTLAGNGQAGSIDAVGSQARFNSPNGGATDPQGNTYIADFGNHRIRKVTPRGVVTTVAGAGVVGYVDGPAITARFNGPLAVFASPSGNLYVADTGNNRIRKIDANGLVTTVAGDGTAGYRDGSGAMARFNFPNDLLLGRDGRLYVSEFNNHTVRRVDANGTVSTLAGNGSPGYVDGAAAAARFNRPSGLALEPDGGILVSEWDGNRIRRMGVDNLVSTVAGTGVAGYVDDTALSAQFRSPDGLAVASDGAIYVADNGNNTIRCIQRNGLVVTVAGTGDSGFLDGRGSLARFASPSGLGIDAAGNLVVPDYANQRVRKITLTPPIPVALALRTLPAVYRPGVVATLPVSLTVTPPTGTTAYAVEDRLPEGWTIGPLIGDGGQYDAVHRTVKFGPFVDGSARTLTYEAQSSVNSQGVARFVGSVSADGNLIPIGGASEITPSVLHPADFTPADNRLSIGELTAYGAAWKRGSGWTIPPNPIPISYVTRAAYLWKNGEVYAYDSQQGEPPLCWVSGAGGVGGWGFNLEPRLYPMADALPGTPLGSKPSGWLPLILDENEASATMPGQYQPGQPVAVDITVTPLSGVMVYAIEDTVPEGWSVASISGDGHFDAGDGKLKWGPYFDDTPRRVSYTAVPPADAASPVSFAGTASFDGVNVKIGGQRQAVPSTVALPLTLTLRTAADGSLSLLLGGQAEGVYRIEFSEDLLLWRPFATVTNGTGAVDLSAGAEGKPTRGFYRVVTVP